MGRKKKSVVLASGSESSTLRHPSTASGFFLDIPGLREADEEIVQLQNQIDEAENKKKNITDSHLLRLEKIIGHAVLELVKNKELDIETIHKWVGEHTKSLKDLKFYKKSFRVLDEENAASTTEKTGE